MNTLKKMTVGFKNYRIKCLIGIEPHERANEQEILVDVQVEIDGSCVAATLSIHDTIDYMLLARMCKEMAQQGRYQLLETYVGEVLDKMMLQYNLLAVRMCVKKPSALIGADYTYVELCKEAK